MISLKQKLRYLLSIFFFVFGFMVTVNLLSLMSLENPNSSFVKTSENSLIIIIMSALNNVHRRNAIRQSWLKLLPDQNEVKFYFVLGSKNLDKQNSAVQTELTLHNDFMFLPQLTDDYENLTEKLIRALVVLTRHHKFKFILKCDDDSFVRIDKIISELNPVFHSKSKLDYLYWGFFDGRAHVKTRGKWKEENWILCDKYLPYALGGGYILSEKLVQFIAFNQENLVRFRSEDVSVGVWLSPLNITRQHDPRFDTEYVSRGCSNTYLVTHKKTPEDMFSLYDNIKKTGNLCKNEIKIKNSYMYNWKSLPSQCCIRNNSSIP